jgi:peptide/nickel transport system permease protein
MNLFSIERSSALGILRFIARRTIYGAFVLLFVSFFSFLLIDLPPGDFLSTYLAQMQQSGMTIDAQTVAAMRKGYGLDQPLIGRYLHWMGKMMHGELGLSFTYQQRVENLIMERLPLTLLITFSTMLLVYSIAIPAGIYAGTHQYSRGDFAISIFGFIGMAVPGFLLALILMWIGYEYFGVSLGGLFSPEYMFEPWSWDKFVDMLKHLPVPIIVIGAAGTAGLIRIMRATLLDELGKQYVTTARAKGLKEKDLTNKYPVRSAMNPIISSAAWILPDLFSGETITAIVLGLPTIGPLFYRALIGQDQYLAASCVMITSALTILGMLVSDIVLAFHDPRIRYD